MDGLAVLSKESVGGVMRRFTAFTTGIITFVVSPVSAYETDSG